MSTKASAVQVKIDIRNQSILRIMWSNIRIVAQLNQLVWKFRIVGQNMNWIIVNVQTSIS